MFNVEFNANGRPNTKLRVRKPFSLPVAVPTCDLISHGTYRSFVSNHIRAPSIRRLLPYFGARHLLGVDTADTSCCSRDEHILSIACRQASRDPASLGFPESASGSSSREVVLAVVESMREQGVPRNLTQTLRLWVPSSMITFAGSKGTR